MTERSERQILNLQSSIFNSGLSGLRLTFLTKASVASVRHIFSDQRSLQHFFIQLNVLARRIGMGEGT